jgi:hypothetical protein
MKRLMVSAALALLAGTAWAQEPLDEGTVVSELVVRPATPGPAWWRIADADSAVYVMIAPTISVAGQPWDSSVLERRMAGANVFILPHALDIADVRSIAGMGAALVQAPGLLLGPRPKVQKKGGQAISLEASLPPDLRDRFVALRTRIGQPEERYAAMKPWRAAAALERDYRAYMKLTSGDEFFGGVVIKDIEATAKKNKVKVEAAWKIVIPPVKLHFSATDEPTFEKSLACLDAGMTRLVSRAERDRAAYMAWREGDVRPLLQRDRLPMDSGCSGPSRSVSVNNKAVLAKAAESFVADQAIAIERALKKPGRSVAVLDPLSPLGDPELGMLGRRGVLERLRAKGYTITAPDVLGEE